MGSRLLAHLAADPAYARVVAVGRRAPALAHAKVEARLADFERLGDLPAVDDAYVALGTTIRKAGSQEAFRRVDRDYVVAVARAARAAGARQLLLVSAVGANAQSRVFYNRVKGEAEDAVRALGYPSLHVFQPSLLVGEREERRTGERVGTLLAHVLAPVLPRRYVPTDADALARAMIAVAKRDEPGARVWGSHDVARVADPHGSQSR